MRFALLSSFVLVSAIAVHAQTPAKPPVQQPGTTAPKPTTPATPAPAQPRRAPATPARSGMTITVTDQRGGTIGGVHVEAAGPTQRMGETNGSGQLNFPGLQAGTYRLTFSAEKWITFEREVTLRAGGVSDVDVFLKPAPEPPPPPAAPEPPAPPPSAAGVVGPTGQPLTIGIVDLLDKEFLGREPRRESLLACSGNERTTMIQLNEAMPQRLYETADVVYYVLGGEGSVTLAGKDAKIATNGLVSVPRGTTHKFDRRGGRPLILLAVLSGEPCERAR